MHLRGDRRRIQTAVHDMEGGLAAENASGVVDVVHGQFADRLARRPEQSSRPLERNHHRHSPLRGADAVEYGAHVVASAAS